MADKYYNPKLRVNIAKNTDKLPSKAQGNLSFVKEGNDSIAYIDISDTERYPLLPVWEEVD